MNATTMMMTRRDDNDKHDMNALKARYQALLPTYGSLWRRMAPKRQHPLSLLSSMETGRAISFRVASSNTCPLTGCEGCAEPIFEDSNSTSNSSPSSSNRSDSVEKATSASRSGTSSASDVAVEALDLSYIRLEGEESPKSTADQANASSKDFAVSPMEQDTFRDAASDNDESTRQSESSACASSSSSSAMEGWDLSHLNLNDDESTTSNAQPDNAINLDSSQVVDLLNDSNDEWIVNVDAKTKGFEQTVSQTVELDLDSNEEETLATKPAARAKNQFHLESSSDEEEWDETNFIDSESVSSQLSNQSPSVIVLSDSEEDVEQMWLQEEEEDSDNRSHNDLFVSSGLDRFASKPFAKEAKVLSDKFLISRNQSTESKLTDSVKGESKASFRRHREQRAKIIFADYDRVVFDGALHNVDLIWSNKLRTTAGLARLRRRSGGGDPVQRTASVELSTKIIDDEDRLRSTLLHEMCHAAAWLVDGVAKPPHGSCFKKWANLAMRRVPSVVVTTTHDYHISFKYAWACTSPKCGAVIQRHSRSVDVAKHCCGKCKSRIMEIEIPSQKRGANVEHTPKKKAPLSRYNLFVKENSKSVRERLENEQRSEKVRVSQQDVVKECGRLWRERKRSTPTAAAAATL